MDGGVAHVDSFDPKPELDRRDGEIYQGNRRWLRSPWRFRRYGQCGMPVSELFPHIGALADELAVVRSMRAELPLHSTGVLLLHTGSNTAGRPSLGSWTTYGLGSENRNLPGFVVLNHDVVPCGGMENYSSGFLPATHQASILRAEGTPLENLTPAAAGTQRTLLDLVGAQDRRFAATLGSSDAVESAVRNHELAFRMQALVPDVLDLGRESRATQQLYGLDSTDAAKRLYGVQCLRARRLVEAGVRFVEVTCPGLFNSNGTWDQHGDLRRATSATPSSPIKRSPASCAICAHAACSTRHWWYGPASSAARRIRRAATGATIIPKASASGSPAAVSVAAPCMARRTKWACMPWSTSRRFMICMRRSCTCSVSIMNG